MWGGAGGSSVNIYFKEGIAKKGALVKFSSSGGDSRKERVTILMGRSASTMGKRCV